MKLLMVVMTWMIFQVGYGQNIEEIKIPQGIKYNYCDNRIIEKAKILISKNLSTSKNFTFAQEILIIGPQLWNRFKEIENFSEIEGGNMYIGRSQLAGKMVQNIKDARKIWDEIKKEVQDNYIIRKANEQELIYYWSVISFPIDEPLLIVETEEHNYILDMSKDDLKLVWLDEAPRINSNDPTSVSKGVRETKLDKLILLSTEEELMKNTSADDISLIVERTSNIFERLFKNSSKEGQILLEFQLNKIENKIIFSIKNDIDVEVMKEFMTQLNLEKFPNSKQEEVKFQLIYKVNSYTNSK